MPTVARVGHPTGSVGEPSTEPWVARCAVASRSVVGFLKSPEWSVPVMEFIDQNCIVFDTEDENKFEYTTIHNEFCERVNALLEGFLTDMGIAPDEFVQVCQSDSAGKLNEFVFNQILAVDDFLSFKKMMVKRNCELNVQAMSMLRVPPPPCTAPPYSANARIWVTSSHTDPLGLHAQAKEAAASQTPPPAAQPTAASEEDDADGDPELAEAIRLSKLTFNAPLTPSRAGTVQPIPDEDDEELRRALAMSMGDDSMIEARKAQEEADLKHAIAMSQAIEEQRLIAIREEQERQHAAAVAASLAEEQARKRAEQAVAEESAAAAAEQKAAAAAAARRAEEEAAVAAAAKAAAEQAERNAADAGQRASDAATVKRAAALPALAPLGAPGEANRPLLSLTRYHSPP